MYVIMNKKKRPVGRRGWRAVGRPAGVVFPSFLFLFLVLLSAPAFAQRRGGGAPGGQAPKEEPKGPTPEELEELHNAYMRSEPEIAPPADPLVISPEARSKIGSDWTSGP